MQSVDSLFEIRATCEKEIMSFFFPVMFSAGDTVSLNRSMDAALHTLRDSGDKWLQKGFQELLDNDFISFWAQCPAMLQIVRGGDADVFVPLILAI